MVVALSQHRLLDVLILPRHNIENSAQEYFVIFVDFLHPLLFARLQRFHSCVSQTLRAIHELFPQRGDIGRVPLRGVVSHVGRVLRLGVEMGLDGDGCGREGRLDGFVLDGGTLSDLTEPGFVLFVLLHCAMLLKG